MRIAIGIDEAGINDDRDMLQEMRLVLRLHREPGMDERVPTTAEVFRMATEEGAHTTPFAAEIGTLEPGKAADIVLMRWSEIAHPYLDPDTAVIDAIVHRAKTRAVETVLVAGEPIYEDRRFTRVDKERALGELAASLAVPRRADELGRRDLARGLLPHLRRFYQDEGYLHAAGGEPYYSFNARHLPGRDDQP